MKISYRPIDGIKPHPDNPRKISDVAVTAVAASLREFGWKQPIVVRKADSTIIVGHARYAAARSLGMEKVPVLVMDCTEAQARAYRLADNRTGEQADWDIGKLTAALRELDGSDFDMLDFGFREIELEMARIDELDIMTGQAPEPWGGDPAAYVSQKQEHPRCILYFGTPEAKAAFFAWLDTQDANWRKQQSKNECAVAYMPARLAAD